MFSDMVEYSVVL